MSYYYGRPKKAKADPPVFKPELYEKTDAIASDLSQKFKSCRKPFASSGVIPLKDTLKDLRFATLPLDNLASETVWKAGAPSKFGHDNTDVYDESYRKATEIRLPDFALSADPLLVGNVLRQIEHLMGTTKHLRAEPYKLNAYGPGGLFKAHRDTPKSNDHVGTITMCLPSTFTGGDLVVRHAGVTCRSDWSNLKDEIGWMFLYSDCEHEVLSVESGTRITIAYDVFAADKQQNYSEDGALKALEQALKEAYADKDFLPEGGWVGLGLKHSYPLEKFKPKVTQQVGDHLKGSDNTWYQAVKHLGLEHKFVGIYDMDSIFYYRAGQNEGYYKFADRFLTTYNTFHRMTNAMVGDGYDGDYWQNYNFAEEHIAWLTEPEAYGGKNHYARYGNEWSSAVCYVALGLTVKFPPPAERVSVEGQ
ncbi:hypothetical protein A1Q1_05950 [Trichosporon asahii var. asahii CBS 2479]|uniref:Fe2OG dioxygenase domain-containing protein n=1 Tax=Trichosporon asahii var. asahii (strain ATCC 90039 / CBS 2479 / JCM 2466 / KCTC 7840 / NBRC 103889/ NCYC 2677 / UAMH 7654) TaxID=1186058 RepID=J6EMJ1_TRIAS|nr:hypothetical protein A1Q1_05950 [Trichosporon asahii var. asahii CBS 2479]EJT45504.1 hypothetical protein A1Q1_05950 [Trichosporon asahii var. asahii CBS 2479]